MKSVLISIKPKWVDKIIIGEKTIEVRKPRRKKYRLRLIFTARKRKTNGVYATMRAHTKIARAKSYMRNNT